MEQLKLRMSIKSIVRLAIEDYSKIKQSDVGEPSCVNSLDLLPPDQTAWGIKMMRSLVPSLRGQAGYLSSVLT